MTPREMAQRIWNNLSNRAGCCLDCWDMDIQEECLSEITAIIQQAVDQARKEEKDSWMNILPPQFEIAKKEAFAQAREMAAKAIEADRVCGLADAVQAEYAKRIRALQGGTENEIQKEAGCN